MQLEPGLLGRIKMQLIDLCLTSKEIFTLIYEAEKIATFLMALRKAYKVSKPYLQLKIFFDDFYV